MSRGVFDIWTNNRRPTNLELDKKHICVFIWVVALFCLFYINCFSYPPPKLKSETKLSDVFDDRHKVEQADPKLLDYIREKHLVKPPPNSIQYQLTGFLHIPNAPLTRFLKRSRDGFFVEFGALDGEYMSNTLFLEISYGWKGLLLEGSPSKFQLLQSKNRKAWLANVCLTENHPEKIEYLQSSISEIKLVNEDRTNPKFKELSVNREYKQSNYNSEGIVECFSLYSVLSAMNVTTVDLLSLKVNEYSILKGIPYEKIDIKVILVEYDSASENPSLIRNLMKEHSYKLVFESQTDFIFVKENKSF